MYVPGITRSLTYWKCLGRNFRNKNLSYSVAIDKSVGHTEVRLEFWAIGAMSYVGAAVTAKFFLREFLPA